MSMSQEPHLRVEAGNEIGTTFTIPPSGAWVGRSSKNDLALTDPLLSRQHCRLEFRGNHLWVIDLASANRTLVNGQVIDECHLHTGDRITIGDTIIRVVADVPSTPVEVTPGTNATATPPPTPTMPSGDGEPPAVDLGLRRRPHDNETGQRVSLRPVLWTVAAVALLLAGALFILKDTGRESTGTPRPLDNQSNRTLEIRYEKIEGDIKNVFRYEMTLAPDKTLAVRIDDLAQQRHVRKESKVDEGLTQQLVREIESSGFFALDPVYTGIQPDSYTLWDLTVVIDQRVHRCRVLNRVEPEKFKAVRERLETFGKNEIGLWAIQFSREKLIELAQDSAQLGRKRYDERGIQYGNLAGAIQSFREAEFYLETVDPKPDFYPDIVSGLQAAREELDRRYAEQRFRADRAINLQEWEAAARELRILCDLIPDREDERHKDANRKLLDVETRLKARK